MMRTVQKLPKYAVFDELKSPVGVLIMIASKLGLHAVLWDRDRNDPRFKQVFNDLVQASDHDVILATKQQLMEYFQGQRQVFDLPLVLEGTEFQVKAWQALLKIPYGKTISYADQAISVGHKNKARAVGLANGLNPISIIVPCHRVIGSNGHLTGFGGGLDKKAFLLNLEQMSVL